MTDASDWAGRVGANWAHEWARTDRSFAGLTTHLVDRVADMQPRAVLDIGCGAGELSLRVGAHCPDTHIIGIDLSADLVAEARARVIGDVRCRFDVADASQWHDAAFLPDLLMSRHGVMFFDTPVGAFTHLARVCAPDARLVFSCFRDRHLNDWATEVAALLTQAAPPQPHAPGPFAFAEQQHVAAILEASGWADIQFRAIDWDYVAGAGDDPVTDAVDFFSRIGPAAPIIAGLAGEARLLFLGQLADLARRHLRADVVKFNASAWIISAKKQ